MLQHWVEGEGPDIFLQIEPFQKSITYQKKIYYLNKINEIFDKIPHFSQEFTKTKNCDFKTTLQVIFSQYVIFTKKSDFAI